MVADGGAVIESGWLNASLAYWSILLIQQNFMCLGFQNQTRQWSSFHLSPLAAIQVNRARP
jgi:hypothetical protein